MHGGCRRRASGVGRLQPQRGGPVCLPVLQARSPACLAWPAWAGLAHLASAFPCALTLAACSTLHHASGGTATATAYSNSNDNDDNNDNVQR